MIGITDWDDAYENAGYIPGAAQYPSRWAQRAAAFRDKLPPDRFRTLQYDQAPRGELDLFWPEGPPKGLAVFIHGGYWMRFHRSDWSHLAAGALARGWAVAIPGYALCPDTTVSGIGCQIAAALKVAASKVAGPIHLAGHSAGGQLATHILCNGLLSPEILARVERVLSISGVHDLRPLLRTARNEVLRLTAAEAMAESPALLPPDVTPQLLCWVGAEERPEFLRQNALLANIWTGLGCSTHVEEVAGRHHFDVIDALADLESAMVRAWLGPF
ncbi:MAG: alpha/beta fold hydrolase [Pseudomonadota bacterium]